MLSEDQRRAFHEDGYLRLPAAVPTAATERMRERLWRMLEHRGACRDDPSTWTPAAATRLQGMRKGDVAPHDSPRVVEALDDLIGPGAWRAQRHWGQVLVTFPNREVVGRAPSPLAHRPRL